jgi:peptidoglycan hydrolase CwlO-like protein
VAAVAAATFLAVVGALAISSQTAGAANVGALQQQIGASQSKVSALSGVVGAYSGRLARLDASISTLQARLTRIETDLNAKQLQLFKLQVELTAARNRLKQLEAFDAHAESVLAQQLVNSYESDHPDIVTVVLEAKGFQDMLERLAFAQRIQRQDVQIVREVRAATARRAGGATRRA